MLPPHRRVWFEDLCPLPSRDVELPLLPLLTLSQSLPRACSLCSSPWPRSEQVVRAALAKPSSPLPPPHPSLRSAHLNRAGNHWLCRGRRAAGAAYHQPSCAWPGHYRLRLAELPPSPPASARVTSPALLPWLLAGRHAPAAPLTSCHRCTCPRPYYGRTS
jgi:hypothetical protein